MFVLLASRRGVTRARLREVVPAYAASQSDDAFERMFERDKEELRGLGVPVETLALDVVHEDEVGYRIDPDAYELPEMSFTRDEMVALGLAARAWSRAGLAGPARDALRKLEALGETVDVSQVGVEPRLASGEPSLGVLHAALTARQAVSFEYRKPGQGVPDRRELEPWGLVTRRGHTYVVGLDRWRGATRVFRLSRIVGEATPVGRPGAFEVPEDLDLVAVISPYEEGDPVGEAVIEVTPGRGAGLRRRATRATDAAQGWTRLTVPFAEPRRLVSELAGLGADVVVLAPPQVRDAVVARLRDCAGTSS